MPTYQYEAMDQTGKTVKDTIEASTQEEAQQIIRQKGFFVTNIGEKTKTKAKAKKKGKKKKKSFTFGKIKPKQLCTKPAHFGRSVQAGRAQEFAGRRGGRH